MPTFFFLEMIKKKENEGINSKAYQGKSLKKKKFSISFVVSIK